MQSNSTSSIMCQGLKKTFKPVERRIYYRPGVEGGSREGQLSSPPSKISPYLGIIFFSILGMPSAIY
jgi:hypothetical protein